MMKIRERMTFWHIIISVLTQLAAALSLTIIAIIFHNLRDVTKLELYSSTNQKNYKYLFFF